MTERRKGIVDPWRTVDSVRPPERVAAPTQERIDIAEIDFDADLAIPGRYILRSAHSCFDVISIHIATPKDALSVLANCIWDAHIIKPLGEALLSAGIGVRCRDRVWNQPPTDAAASTLKSDDVTIWFVEKPFDQGMLVLARILRMPEGAHTCKRHGVTVMLTA